MEGILKLIAEYRIKEINNVIDFLNECCTQNINAITKTKDVYESYVVWCKSSKNEFMVKKNMFIIIIKKQLEENGISITNVKTNSYRGWKGISLKVDGESLNIKKKRFE